MSDSLQLSATDKEIYDVLMGAKTRFTETALFEMARERGILYSKKESRESLASKVALLPHGYRSLLAILDRRETSARSEPVTHIHLPVQLEMEQIKEVAQQFKADSKHGEAVECARQGANAYKISVRYTDIDYSKTQLLQRREKEADIEILVENGRTLIRSPSNDKAISIVQEIKGRIEQAQKETIPEFLIDLRDIPDPVKRSSFFTKLISSMPGFQLRTVTRLRVHKQHESDSSLDLSNDEEGFESAEEEMLSFVRAVSLNGRGLHLSDLFQEFQQSGFYIHSMLWTAEKKGTPDRIVEFEASFSDPENCSVFQYKVRGVAPKAKGEYPRRLKHPEPNERVDWLRLLESTAHKVIEDLKNSSITEGEEP